MLSVDIYGSLVYTPDNPLETLIEGWGKPREEQKWTRKDLPSFFNRVEYDEDGNAMLTLEQERYAAQEVKRCKEGYWLFINGTPVFITGKHYFYLQWWTLEDDINPEYRDTDRRYFLFLDYWERILWCLGILRGKKRREGASSQATSNLIYECIFFTNSNCGLVSKTQIDSRNTFTDMVRHGYTGLPIFLKPRLLSKPDSVTELIFGAKIESGKDGDGGQRSKVNYRAPVLNAYDSGRMSRILGDEGGKWPPEVDFAKFLSIVSKTMVKGAKRVGFGEFPSTVNEMTKGGGMAFKKAWDGGNQFKFPNKPTPNRMVTYFSAAYDGYEGFIDQWGGSVIGEPTSEQYEYLVAKWVKKDPITGEIISELTEDDIKMGAKRYVMVKRREGLNGDLLEEEIRMNPCTVDEMFEAANTDCAFNSFNINKRIKELEENPPFIREVVFYRDMEQKIHWRDVQKEDKNFHWKIIAFPKPEDTCKFKYDGKLKIPDRQESYVIGIDGYSNSQSGRKYGSKASAWIFKKFDINDPDNSGKLIGHLYGRPKEKDTLHEQVMMASEYFSCKGFYEFNSDDFYSYFRDRGKLGYLGKFPYNSLDPEKRNQDKVERFYGFPTTPFSLTKQLDTMIAYIEHYCDRIDFIELLQNCKLFDPYNRTSYDCVVAAMITLVSSLDTLNKQKRPTESLVKSFVNSHFGQN